MVDQVTLNTARSLWMLGQVAQHCSQCEAIHEDVDDYLTGREVDYIDHAESETLVAGFACAWCEAEIAQQPPEMAKAVARTTIRNLADHYWQQAQGLTDDYLLEFAIAAGRHFEQGEQAQ